ncbi:unnamed protein product, partial [Ectocarpus sp. 8 AP-2014]
MNAFVSVRWSQPQAPTTYRNVAPRPANCSLADYNICRQAPVPLPPSLSLSGAGTGNVSRQGQHPPKINHNGMRLSQKSSANHKNTMRYFASRNRGAIIAKLPP